MNIQPPFLTGERIILRALTTDDASRDYLSWLNDPDVLRYRGPKAWPTTMADLKDFLGGLSSRTDLVLAIRESGADRHVGNIALNTILWPHGSAELSVMIGSKDVWGAGYGREAVGLLTKHAFERMGLHRIWAESPNPAFNATVKTLGWYHEGTKREAFLLDGEHIDIECWGLLASAVDGQE